MPLEVVSKIVGHKDPAFTARVYNKIRPERLRAAADALQEHYYGAAR